MRACVRACLPVCATLLRDAPTTTPACSVKTLCKCVESGGKNEAPTVDYIAAFKASARGRSTQALTRRGAVGRSA